MSPTLFLLKYKTRGSRINTLPDTKILHSSWITKHYGISNCSNVTGIHTKQIADPAEAVVRRSFVKKLFLKFSRNPQENTCATDSFLNKVAGLRPETFREKNWLWHSCFPVNFAKFLRISVSIEHLFWLLLKFAKSAVFLMEELM